MLNSSSASISKKTESQKVNYFAEWQKELKERKALEQTIYSLQQYIVELERK